MSAWKLCLCAIVLLFLVAAANATMIDSFGSGKQSLSVDPDSQFASGQVATSAAIGGYRDISLQWKSGDLDFANVTPSGGKLTFTQSTSESIATVTWDGENSPDVRSYLLGANLTSGGKDGFSIPLFAVTGSSIDLSLTVYTDAGHASLLTMTLPAGGPRTLSLRYTDFRGIGGVTADFTNVGAIVLGLSGVGHLGSDVTIGSIQTVTTPEPSTLALLAIGAAALIALRRRRT
ncbi:MAG: PEP-CTERM sorting domain-containing protein [Thermoguttaceae bacterium]